MRIPSRQALQERATLFRAVRTFFDARDFLEVETPVRITAPAPECHIDCPPVVSGGFLRASPEIEMKKLLASGCTRIYQMGPCFREAERGARHNPEFTMLEWYRADATYHDIARDLMDLLHVLAPSRATPQTITVREAYQKYAAWDPFASWDEDRFDFDMATKIEPALKPFEAVFLTDYPPQAASLARIQNGVAERWEFYMDGIELANCFTELCDPVEQRERFLAARAARARLGEADYPIDEDFFRALGNISSAAGVAVGMDRLAMILQGASHISSVRYLDARDVL